MLLERGVPDEIVLVAIRKQPPSNWLGMYGNFGGAKSFMTSCGDCFSSHQISEI